jgi:hypothetical protein
MKLFLFLAVAALPLHAALPQREADRIVAAIYRAEGPRHPYGILSVRVTSREQARRVCLRTVQNTHGRWIRAGRPGRFLDFLADRYCPPSVDPVGNANWRRNVR